MIKPTAKFSYLAPIARLNPPEPPFRYAYAPPKGRPLHNEILDDHIFALNDIRDHREVINLDTAGFDLITRKPTTFDDWGNTEKIAKHYYPETIKLLQKHLGASKIHIFDHTIRRRNPEKDQIEDKIGQVRREQSHPLCMLTAGVNLCFETPKAGDNRVAALLGDKAGTEALKKRVQIINIWRPLRGPVVDAPIGLIHARSIDWNNDMAVGEILYRDRIGYTYLVHHNPKHEWFYASEMMSDEVILIKCYDSKLPRAVAAHSGFAFENPPIGFQPRQSIEVRAMVFYDDE